MIFSYVGSSWPLHVCLISSRLEELGASHALCGLARLVMCVAEVPFFYLSGPLIRRVGARGVIALTQLGYLARFAYYSVRWACASVGVLSNLETRLFFSWSCWVSSRASGQE